MPDMMTVETNHQADKSTRRPRPKSAPRPAANATNGQDEKKIKTAVHLSRGAMEKLLAACAKELTTQSQVIEYLISKELARYVLQVRGDRIDFTATNDRSRADDQARESGPIAA